MARTNTKAVAEKKFTHGGAPASLNIGKREELERTVASCLLWENQFYESGSTIGKRIQKLVTEVEPEFVLELAIRARNEYKLRHVGLFLVAELERQLKTHTARPLVANTLTNIIQRPDELTEFLAMYWKDKKPNGKHTPPLTAQAKKGLARAFEKFNEYQLAKYDNQERSFKLKDVFRLVTPTTTDTVKYGIWGKLLKDELATPDTWEVALSGGADKKETFERLISEKKLGALALLRNLRNMEQAGVSRSLVETALENAKVDNILPFRFIAAAKHNPKWESSIEKAMFKNLAGLPKLKGKTVLMIDVSGSMGAQLSGKSELTRMESAFALSVLIRELAEDVSIYCTGGNDYSRKHSTALVPDRRGFALVDAMRQMESKLGGGGIFLTQCLDYVNEHEKGKVDRVIVFTDEADCSGPDAKLSPDKAKLLGTYNYIANVASYDCGIAYNKFLHINGFSDRLVDFIQMYENNANVQYNR